MASRPSVALIAALTLPATLPAQEGFSLDIASIMRGPEQVGREPSQVRWSPDGQWIHFSWLPPGSDWRASLEPYRVRARPGATPEPIARATADSLAPTLAGGLRSRDGSRRFVSSGGDLYVVELPSGRTRRLTETRATEQLVGITRDEQVLHYREGNNLFALRLADGFVRQLTDVRSGAAPDTSSRTPAQRRALERDQLALFAALRDDARRDSLQGLERARRDSLELPTVWLGRDWRVRTLMPSPTGTHALLITSLAPSPDPRSTEVPRFVTRSGFTEEITARSKVGDTQGKQRVGVLELATGTVAWVQPIAGDSSQVYGALGDRGWNDAGSAVLVMADSRDHTRRVLARIEVDSVRAVPVNIHVDSAWVGGPCGSCAAWLPDDRGIWFVDESTGHAHLYVMGRDGRKRALTRGAWEVRSVSLSPDRTRFELTTSEGSPFEQHYYTMALDGSDKMRLTQARGAHDVTPSPDRRWLANVHSTGNAPPELFLMEATPGAAMSRLTTSPTAAWRGFDWVDPEIVMIPASDRVEVPARIYRPEQLGARPNGAAVLFVHGAGYLHNVHHWWSSYYREYQFHHLLASRGYVVLDVDYRGSDGYGRDWRTAIYRHMGGRDLEDYVDASRWLTSTMGIPGDRIGIYGGSYGGFITLMALFTRPEYFGAGAALRSVTDWSHYNHGYTARILNEPQDDSLAYHRSSPIHFAEGLEDPLLIAHGMIDTNVHFQDVVRLTQRLIELGKEHWELAVYPVENHGFTRPDSWTDEYRRILELFERWLPDRQRTRE
jgi:dipeptidyl aminopeptidase/acylaminoacyl peptidase